MRGGDQLALERRAVRLGKPPLRWRRYPFAARVASEPFTRTIYAEPVKPAFALGPGNGKAAGAVTGAAPRGPVRGRTEWVGLDGTRVSVETRALQFYASEEGGRWTGRHCEGGIWSALFALLLWDVLFAPGYVGSTVSTLLLFF